MLNNFKILLGFLTVIHTTSVQTTEHKVVAKPGDGIYSLFRDHKIDPVYVDAFITLNKANIIGDNKLLIGKTYILPATQKTQDSITGTTVFNGEANKKIITNTIFGPEYETISIESTQLKNAVYYLISGHGGPDPGTTSNYSFNFLTEDEYAYDVTLRLARKLISQGATVYIIIQDKNDGIRDDHILKVDYDEICYPNQKIPRDQRSRLKQRTDIVNKLYLEHKGAYQRLISTHIDSRANVNTNIDVYFFHQKNSLAGKNLAENIRNTIEEKYAIHQPNRGYTGQLNDERNLYVVKRTAPPAVLIELGNIQNARDQKRILKPENREALANWIYEGLVLDHQTNEN